MTEIPAIRAMRIARDHSLYFLLSDGRRFQLSEHQLAALIVAANDERGFVPSEQLHTPLFGVSGPATASQRAVLCRLRSRLEERGLIVGGQTRIVRVTPLGRLLAEHAISKSWRPVNERIQLSASVSTVPGNDTLLTIGAHGTRELAPSPATAPC